MRSPRGRPPTPARAGVSSSTPSVEGLDVREGLDELAAHALPRTLARAQLVVPAPAARVPGGAAPSIGGELVTWTPAAAASRARPALTAAIRRASPDCMS